MQTNDPEVRRAKAWCTASLVLSVVVMFGGLAWAYIVGMEAVKVSHPLDHIESNVSTLRANIAKLEARTQ